MYGILGYLVANSDLEKERIGGLRTEANLKATESKF
jgi:hypothetical protein